MSHRKSIKDAGPKKTFRWTTEECSILWGHLKDCGTVPLLAAREAQKNPLFKGRNVGSIEAKARRLLKDRGIKAMSVDGADKTDWTDKETEDIIKFASGYNRIMTAAKAYSKKHPHRSIYGCEGKIRLLIKQGKLDAPDMSEAIISPDNETPDYYTMDVGIHNIKIRDQIFAEMGV